jgi:predicted AAA+ superfamily ATPase
MRIDRKRQVHAVESALERNPIGALLGPRQCGKTTLAREVAARHPGSHVFDLETAKGRAQLAQPELALSELEGLVVIDEIQRQPELFAALRPLVDRPGRTTRFLVLGSAAPSVVRGVSESLAGRVGLVDLGPFDLEEVGAKQPQRLWLRGGFPRSYLARDDEASLAWRHDFIRTFLERDIPQLGIRIAPEALRRFWMMIAHYHGQVWSGAELARSLGVSEHTVRGYLDLLCGTFVLRQLPPWHENLSKRQVRSAKVYVRDSGLLHALLTLGTHAELLAHPKLGASWEGFAVEQILSVTAAREVYFWATQSGAELDLLLIRGGRRLGFEFKCADAPQMTKSLHVALADLRLDRAWIVYPGHETYRVHERVDVVPIEQVPARLRALTTQGTSQAPEPA